MVINYRIYANRYFLGWERNVFAAAKIKEQNSAYGSVIQTVFLVMLVRIPVMICMYTVGERPFDEGV